MKDQLSLTSYFLQISPHKCQHKKRHVMWNQHKLMKNLQHQEVCRSWCGVPGRSGSPELSTAEPQGWRHRQRGCRDSEMGLNFFLNIVLAVGPSQCHSEAEKTAASPVLSALTWQCYSWRSSWGGGNQLTRVHKDWAGPLASLFAPPGFVATPSRTALENEQLQGGSLNCNIRRCVLSLPCASYQEGQQYGIWWPFSPAQAFTTSWIGFLNLDSIDIWGKLLVCQDGSYIVGFWGASLASTLWKLVSNILMLHPTPTHPGPDCGNPKCLQKFLNVSVGARSTLAEDVCSGRIGIRASALQGEYELIDKKEWHLLGGPMDKRKTTNGRI